MEGCKERICSHWKSSSCSARLLGFIFPLMVVAGLVAFAGSKSSNWLLGPGYYTWAWSSVLPKASFSNYSNTAAPTVAVGDGEAGTPVDKTIDSSITNNGSSVFLSFSDIPAAKAGLKITRKFSSLDIIEMKLQQARTAIKDAERGNGTSDPDYVPTGPIYWNPTAFHRSYIEMEKQFKVFVYEEGEHPLFHNGPCGGIDLAKGIYSTEGNFIHKLETSKFRTRNPEKAHVFFLPFSGTFIVYYVHAKEAMEYFRSIKRIVTDYIDLVAGRYPYWNRSSGADHFMLSCHDWAPDLSTCEPNLSNNSIRALCNANTSEGFRPSKDVSIPEIFRPGGHTYGIIGGPPPSQRPILAFYAGGVRGDIRMAIMKHWAYDRDIHVHDYLPKNVSYLELLSKSKYCLCPSGYEVASPRMVEALYGGCVPVMIKDHYVAPFSDVLNWKSFSIELSSKEIPNLKKILLGISTKQYLRMYRRGVQARRHFMVNLIPKRYDVFHMILHSIWLRRLNLRVGGVEDS